MVGQRRISAGETALPGVPVLTLLEVGRVKVRFSVPELEIARLGADSRIGVGVAALGDRAVSYTHLDVYKRQSITHPCMV